MALRGTGFQFPRVCALVDYMQVWPYISVNFILWFSWHFISNTYQALVCIFVFLGL